MARYSRPSSRRRAVSSGRRTRRTGATRSYSAPRRRASSRRAGTRSSRPQVVRLEIVQAAPNPVARPEIGVMPASAPRKAQF